MDTKSHNPLPEELIAQLSEHCKTKDDLDGIMKMMWQSLLNQALDTEMDEHLGYKKHESAGRGSDNRRNGRTSKTLKGELGPIEVETPRDRNSQFEPQIVPKHKRRFEGFDHKILALYAKGMTTRDVQQTLEELYDVEVSPGLISQVTEAVQEEDRQWQARPLDEVYPIVFLDGLVVKVRVDGRITQQTIYLAVGINMQGKKELLGLWISQNEGAKFWLDVLTDLKNRGLKDIFVACVDGLKGFPDAIQTVFPQTQVQLCLVHLVRNALRYVSFKDRKAVAGDLKLIYRAATLDEAESALEEFSQAWDTKYPAISRSWKNHWENLIPFFEYPEDIRRVIYTTNAIESINSVIRKAIRNRKIFPSKESAVKIVYLAIREASKKWTMPIQNWNAALNRFAIAFEDRFPQHLV